MNREVVTQRCVGYEQGGSNRRVLGMNREVVTEGCWV